jgi:hypothetical protein
VGGHKGVKGKTMRLFSPHTANLHFPAFCGIQSQLSHISERNEFISLCGRLKRLPDILKSVVWCNKWLAIKMQNLAIFIGKSAHGTKLFS